jgi:hypothetical protein
MVRLDGHHYCALSSRQLTAGFNNQSPTTLSGVGIAILATRTVTVDMLNRAHGLRGMEGIENSLQPYTLWRVRKRTALE